MERPEDTEVVDRRHWTYWLLEWNVLEVFPFCCACVGFVVGVAGGSFIVGYIAGQSWLENLAVKKLEE